MKKIIIVLSLLAILTVEAFAQRQLRGEWQFMSVTSKTNGELQLSTDFDLSLVFERNRVNVNGCNHAYGKYTAEKKRIRIDISRITSMLCSGNDKESLFLDYLEKIANYSIHGTELVLSNKNNTLIIKLLKR